MTSGILYVIICSMEKKNKNLEKRKSKGGRPKGAKNKSTLLKEAMESEATDLIVKHFPSVVEKACELAAQGDTRAMKLLFDRIIPVKKASDRDPSLANKGVTIIVQGAEAKETETIEDAVFEEVLPPRSTQG